MAWAKQAAVDEFLSHVKALYISLAVSIISRVSSIFLVFISSDDSKTMAMSDFRL
jgi:hypothetical protein